MYVCVCSHGVLGYSPLEVGAVVSGRTAAHRSAVSRRPPLIAHLNLRRLAISLVVSVFTHISQFVDSCHLILRCARTIETQLRPVLGAILSRLAKRRSYGNIVGRRGLLLRHSLEVDLCTLIDFDGPVLAQVRLTVQLSPRGLTLIGEAVAKLIPNGKVGLSLIHHLVLERKLRIVPGHSRPQPVLFYRLQELLIRPV